MAIGLSKSAGRIVCAVLAGVLAATAMPSPAQAVTAGAPGPILYSQWSVEHQDWFLHTLAPEGEPVIIPGTNQARAGRWSPDGRVITYTIFGQGIYIINPDGSGKRLLFEPGEGEGVGEAVWSPDGTRLAYGIIGPDAPLGRVEIADSLSGARQRVDTGLAYVWDWPDPGFLLGSAWREADGSPNGNEEIARYSFATGKLTYLTDSPDQEGVPRLSPDGSMITFLAWSPSVPGNYAIGVMNADGSNKRLVRPTQGQVTWPAWSPAGDAIVFGPRVRAMTIDGLNTWPLGGGWAQDGFDWAPLVGTTQQFAMTGVRALALPDPSVKATASASTTTIKPSNTALSNSAFTAAAAPRSVTINQMIREPAFVRLRIFRPSGKRMLTIRFGLKTGRVPYTWNGRLPSGKLAPAGTYKFVSRAVDLAGNVK
jgi:hypothetical protein